MKLLPFNFDRLESGDYFLSNMAGFHSFLAPKELHELIDFSNASCPSTSKHLQSSLFIAPEESADASVAAMASALARKLQLEFQFKPTFMIVPTLRCDHTCRYCQVSRAPKNGLNYDLAIDAIPNIIGAIKKLSSPPYKLEIQGGEPLIRFDLINRLYSEAEEQLGTDTFEFVIATSLSLLDENTLSWAKYRNVYFSTSLDGDAVIHNANRILHSDNSFQRVKWGVAQIQTELGADRVATVTTVTRELLKDPEALVAAHLEMGLYDLFVRPISPYGFANTNSAPSYSIPEYMQFYRHLFNCIKSHTREGETLIEHSAAIHIKRILNPGFSLYADLKSPSGLILNCLLFNYDGKVYGSDEARMLQRVLVGVDLSCGDINAMKLEDNTLYTNILGNTLNLLHPGCEQCAYQPFCGSDPCQSISVQGEPIGDKSFSLFCQYHKAMFRFLLNEFHNDAASHKLLKEWSHG
ncbi:His-Xaa-Ser system radical SAM maturase HxsB [Hahella sp. CR1]|uniref:His-Xaa-Ser system radical SAM maturase HxsB n=1 Tax=Hahella sp. CR1 TaxID=2992807 RepID=UPI002442D6F6|nr:His-Xaa-Ser system radical SAM maturase HxsB [Hahella sp. CR1]MDG9670545.1 His-Xaa-Ser system radical SAM maturase HxsB [Hahella sp. CR1]